MKSAKFTRATLVVLDQTNMLSLAAAVDPLRAANRQAGRTVYDWQFATPTAAPVHLTSGLVLPENPVARVPATDLLIVIAGFEIARQMTPRLGASLRRLAHRAEIVAGIDGGPWVLAEAGLLDGHRATTHWEDFDAFATRFSQVEAVNARYVASGNRITCSGAAPGIDMMLHLISSQHGPALAGRVAGVFIHDPPRSTTPQSRGPVTRAHNALTARAQRLMETALETPRPITDIASALGVSPRVLQQQFRDRLGTTPQAHYLGLRLGEAHRLVTQGTDPLLDIALATGFSSQASFARAFRAAFGASARALRRAADIVQ